MRILVVCGGESPEHSVSLVTTRAVLESLDPEHEVILVGITPEGKHILLPEVGDWNLADSPVLEDNDLEILWPFGGGNLAYFEYREIVPIGQIDVCLPLLHGDNGEDGSIQGLLQLCHIPFVGNGISSSAAAMDKQLTKNLARQAGVPVCEEKVIQHDEFLNDPETAFNRLQQNLTFPVVVKPAKSGSSIGVSVAENSQQLLEAVKVAFEEDDRVLVEPRLTGREIEIAVLEDLSGDLETSVAGEIKVAGGGIYDYRAKYLSNTAELIVPAELTDEQLQKAQSYAKDAFRALGCKGLARVDFFLTSEGWMLSEVNTMPGFTPISMYPKLWKESGIDYPELVSRLVQLAIR
jgi:D-alanine-D-alanine ligase